MQFARWNLGVLIAWIWLGLHSPAGQAATLDLWLSPADDVTQHGRDFHELFIHAERWRHAASYVRVFSVAANYLLRAPPEDIHRELEWLRANQIKLDVSIAVVGVDKKICGDGIEGMIWPGEAGANANRLAALGADVASFSLDLPLSMGHLITKHQTARACELSIHEVAVRTAQSVRELNASYPLAKIYDSEVPTGVSLKQWTTTLHAWLVEYKMASGKQFGGLTMDVWWKFPWKDTVKATSRILADQSISAGIFIDESAGRDLPAVDWVDAARHHVCELAALGIRLDYMVVADWSNMNVRSLPESDPTTLTSLLDWTIQPKCPL